MNSSIGVAMIFCLGIAAFLGAIGNFENRGTNAALITPIQELDTLNAYVILDMENSKKIANVTVGCLAAMKNETFHHTNECSEFKKNLQEVHKNFNIENEIIMASISMGGNSTRDKVGQICLNEMENQTFYHWDQCMEFTKNWYEMDKKFLADNQVIMRPINGDPIFQKIMEKTDED